MNKIRAWFNKPNKEVGNKLMIRPLTLDSRHQASHDVTVEKEMLSSAQREPLQGDTSQEEEVSDVQQQHYCPEHLRTTTTSASLPVWRSQVEQVEQVTGDRMQTDPTSDLKSGSGSLTPGTCDIISLTPTGGGATDTGTCDITSASCPGLPLRPFLKMRDDCSLPSSPRPRGRRLPCSLPCSPLLGGRRWRSSPTSPSPPPCLSRLWVEAALQRSKNIRPPPPCSPQVRQEGQEEEGEEGGDWSDQEEDKQVNSVGIRLSDTVIFRPMMSPGVCGREEEEEGEDDSDVLCLDSEASRYCLLTPCVCFRCPSAPPYEAEVFSAANIQTDSSFSSENQNFSEGFKQLFQRTNVKKTYVQSLPRAGAPQLGEGSRLYPSLSLWRTAADSQSELNRKQEEEVNSFDSKLDHNAVQSCLHGNTDDQLRQLCEMIPGAPGELHTLCSADRSFILKTVCDSTTCRETAARPVESCSFCSDKLSVQITKLTCRD